MDIAKADAAIKNAWMAGIVSGVITLIVTAVAMYGYSFMGFSALNLLDVALIFGLTFGIYRKSRVCAVIMLIYFIGSKIYLWMDTGKLSGLPLALVFGYYFFQGVLGTFAYHSNADTRMKPAAKSGSGPEPKFKTREEYEQWKTARLAQPQGETPAGYGIGVQPVEKKSSSFGWGMALILIAVIAVALLFTDSGKTLLSKINPVKTPAWEEFSSSEGNFSVQMPGAPSHQTEQVQTAIGPIDMHLFSRELGSKIAYIVIYSDYPEVITRASPDQVLDGGRDAAVANSKGKLLSEERIFLDGGHAGREIVVEVPDQGVMKLRVYLVRQRLYQIMLLASKERIDSEENAKYFTSFKLLSIQ